MTPLLPRAPEQRGARHGLHDLVAADDVERALVGDEPVDLLQARAERQDHVVARVAVGDREDVQVVDLLAAGLEVHERAGDDGTKAQQTWIGHAPARPV